MNIEAHTFNFFVVPIENFEAPTFNFFSVPIDFTTLLGTISIIYYVITNENMIIILVSN
jgi:hypothetical protein